MCILEEMIQTETLLDHDECVVDLLHVMGRGVDFSPAVAQVDVDGRDQEEEIAPGGGY